MQKQFLKIDENIIQVTTTHDLVVDIVKHNINFLRQQKMDIQGQKEREKILRDAELAEVAEIIEFFDNNPLSALTEKDEKK